MHRCLMHQGRRDFLARDSSNATPVPVSRVSSNPLMRGVTATWFTL